MARHPTDPAELIRTPAVRARIEAAGSGHADIHVVQPVETATTLLARLGPGRHLVLALDAFGPDGCWIAAVEVR